MPDDAESTSPPPSSLSDVYSPVLVEVARERDRQGDLWGEQNHANFSSLLPDSASSVDVAELYGIPTADAARDACEASFDADAGSWAHILVEEFAEAFAEHRDPQALRTELVQVAAVVVSWIEAMDRKASQ